MGKPDGRSALFLEMDAKFRAIQNNQERIIKLLEGGDEKPKKEETITEAYAWTHTKITSYGTCGMEGMRLNTWKPWTMWLMKSQMCP